MMMAMKNFKKFIEPNTLKTTTSTILYQSNPTTPLLSTSEEPEEAQDDEPTSNGTATLISSIANISNTILGTGMLAMAHGFAAGGLILGFSTVLICGGMAYFGLILLSRCADHPKIPRRNSSFFAIASITYPRTAWLFDLAIAIKCFGVSISYLLIFGRLMPQVILGFESMSSSSRSEPNPSILLDRRLWITISMIILVPISFLRKLDSLRYTSYIALIAVIDLVFVVIYKFFDRTGLEPPGEIRLIRLSESFVAALPVYVFAYTCAQNIFSVHNELISNSRARMKLVLGTSIGSAALIYEVVGTLGYLTFGSNVSSNLISDYHNSLFISICRAAISILVLFSYPLQLHPCRNSLEKVLEAWKISRKSGRTHHSVRLSDDDDRPETVEEEEEEESQIMFFGITTGLLLASFLIAVNVERLETVLGFVGSTGSTTISYILPGFFFLKMFDEESLSENDDDRSINLRKLKLMRLSARFLVLAGFVIMVVCLSLNVKDVLGY